MTPVDLLGWVAAALGMASTLPQLLRLIRVRRTEGLSLSLFQLNAAASGAWAFHGFMVRQPQLQWPNLVVLVLSLAVVLLIATSLLIVFMIQTAVFARRREIEVQRLVGATNWFIRIPFILEGVVHALIGWAAATAGLWGLTWVWRTSLG